MVTCCAGHATFTCNIFICTVLISMHFPHIPHVHDTGSLYFNTDLPDVSLPPRPTNIAFEMFGLTFEALKES